MESVRTQIQELTPTRPAATFRNIPRLFASIIIIVAYLQRLFAHIATPQFAVCLLSAEVAQYTDFPFACSLLSGIRHR